jgi:hypothetical protein
MTAILGGLAARYGLQGVFVAGLLSGVLLLAAESFAPAPWSRSFLRR